MASFSSSFWQATIFPATSHHICLMQEEENEAHNYMYNCFIYVAGKQLKTVSLDGISLGVMHIPYQTTVTDDGVFITVDWCKPHQSRNSPTDSQTTRSDNRSSTEDSRSSNNDSVDHSDDGTEEMSRQRDSEEDEEELCLMYYKLNY